MQMTVLGVFIVLQVMLLLVIYRLHNINKKNIKTSDIIRRLRDTAFCMVCIIAAQMLVLLAKERWMAYLAFTLYYIAFAWYCLLIFRFSVIYSRYRLRRVYQTPFFWFMFAESVALVWGMFSEGFFTIAHVRWYGHIFWISRSFSVFYVYGILSGTALFGAVVSLLVAATKSARIYRLKYISIALVIAVTAALSVVCGWYELPLMLQVICFAVCELIVVYMAVYYAPRKLNQRAMRFVADKLNDGIVLYDDEHQLQLVTEGYQEAFGPGSLDGIGDEETYWADRMAEANVENAWNGRVKSVVRDGQVFYYEIQHMPLSEEDKLIGTVYWIRNVTESIENNREMVRRANFDELTGIYNEAHFHETSRKVLEDNPDTTFVISCSSIEKYRVFKQLFGAKAYEEYLIRTAETLRTGLAGFPNCRYGIIGASDFYVLMPKELFEPQQFLDAIDRVADHFSTNNFNLKVKAGVYEINDSPPDMQVICNKVSMACEAIKGDYGKRIVWFDQNIQNESMRKERYNAELSKAIENGEIQIYLQPQIDNNGILTGAEALARWNHREDGFISPIQFIPYFEKNGRITELDICIWRQACEKLREWKERGRDDLYLSVNISPKDLYALDIFEHYQGLVQEFGISPRNLKLEITESAIINDLKRHVRLVERLQEAGFEVEMDDFGSAYSSFNMLKDICVDVLKIDMKFLGETENEERSHAILKSIVSLSRELNMRTIAEGVETKEQLEFLGSVGCDLYQGYYFDKPMSVADFEAKYF